MYARKNLLKEKLKNGEIVVGMEVWLRDPWIIEMMANAGFDIYHLENEHVAHNWETVENLLRTANLVGMTPLYRCGQCFNGQPPVNEIIKAFKCGAQILMAPQVNTPDCAKKIVEAVKYAPLGKRGIATCDQSALEIFPNESHMEIDMKRFTQEINDETMIWAIIESPEAVENVDKILEVDGIDALFFGWQDYTIAAGLSKDFGSEIEDAREKVRIAAQKAGKVLCTSPAKPEEVEDLIKKGYQVFMISVDIFFLNEILRKIIKVAKKR